MASGKGFTILEIMVVLIIVGVLAAVSIPRFTGSIEQTKAAAAQSNLLAIEAGEQKYFEDNASYCVASCTTTATINTNLLLEISDNFTYACAAFAGTIPYNCTATDPTDTLTLNPNVVGASPVSCAGPSGSCP